VRELLKIAPRLANASWDWGLGDWETPLGAAAHTGRRAIAELLLEHGARVDVFCLAMMGNLDAVRTMIGACPGLQRVRGPHGISLMKHALAGGTEAKGVAEYLESLGDADAPLIDLPLDDDQLRMYAGMYAFGDRASDRFEIFAREKVRGLAVRRAARKVGDTPSPLNLLHLGEHAFYPAGAPEAQLRFTVEGGRATRVAITTPAPLCEARRADV